MQGIILMQMPVKVLNFCSLTKWPVFREAICHKTNPHQSHSTCLDPEAAEGASATATSNPAQPILP